MFGRNAGSPACPAALMAKKAASTAATRRRLNVRLATIISLSPDAKLRRTGRATRPRYNWCSECCDRLRRLRRLVAVMAREIVDVDSLIDARRRSIDMRRGGRRARVAERGCRIIAKRYDRRAAQDRNR